MCLSYCSLDKALHSAGISTGFIIFGTNLTNPLNDLLLALQPVSSILSFVSESHLCPQVPVAVVCNHSRVMTREEKVPEMECIVRFGFTTTLSSSRGCVARDVKNAICSP